MFVFNNGNMVYWFVMYGVYLNILLFWSNVLFLSVNLVLFSCNFVGCLGVMFNDKVINMSLWFNCVQVFMMLLYMVGFVFLVMNDVFMYMNSLVMGVIKVVLDLVFGVGVLCIVGDLMFKVGQCLLSNFMMFGGVILGVVVVMCFGIELFVFNQVVKLVVV